MGASRTNEVSPSEHGVARLHQPSNAGPTQKCDDDDDSPVFRATGAEDFGERGRAYSASSQGAKDAIR